MPSQHVLASQAAEEEWPPPGLWSTLTPVGLGSNQALDALQGVCWVIPSSPTCQVGFSPYRAPSGGHSSDLQLPGQHREGARVETADIPISHSKPGP